MIVFDGRGILLDVEGTTSSIAFVYDVLFAHAKAQVADFLAAHEADPAVRAAAAGIAATAGLPTADLDDAAGRAAVALAATFAITTSLKSMPAAGTETASVSEPYSAAKLEALRAEGRPVFINFTAAWCITCKVNERIALSKTEVEEAFKKGNVAYLKGDWTNRNAEISAALQAVGRDGVPLYLYYAPKASEPVILPQVLTPATVIATVAK